MDIITNKRYGKTAAANEFIRNAKIVNPNLILINISHNLTSNKNKTVQPSNRITAMHGVVKCHD